MNGMNSQLLWNEGDTQNWPILLSMGTSNKGMKIIYFMKLGDLTMLCPFSISTNSDELATLLEVKAFVIPHTQCHCFPDHCEQGPPGHHTSHWSGNAGPSHSPLKTFWWSPLYRKKLQIWSTNHMWERGYICQPYETKCEMLHRRSLISDGSTCNFSTLQWCKSDINAVETVPWIANFDLFPGSRYAMWSSLVVPGSPVSPSSHSATLTNAPVATLHPYNHSASPWQYGIQYIAWDTL